MFFKDNKNELNKVKGIVLEREDGECKENWGRRSLQFVMGGDSNSINNKNNKNKVPFFLNKLKKILILNK